MRSATPKLMKQVNESLLRKALRERGRAAQSDLARDTGLSLTTVALALGALEDREEIRRTGLRESRGGRKAAEYELNPGAARLYAVAVEGDHLDWAIANALGTIISEGSRLAHADPIEETIRLVNDMKNDALSAPSKRAAAAIGIPGAVQNGRIITGKFSKGWGDSDLAAHLRERTGLPTVVENDVNASALGFARRSQIEGNGPANLVYVFRNDDGTGAGVVADGNLIRGAAQFAGELGYLPLWGKRNFDQVLSEASSDEEYALAYASALAAVNCVVNPALCVVGGSCFRFELSDAIEKELNAQVDASIRPKLVFEKDTRFYYLCGLCALAAGELFPGYRLVDSRP